MEDLQWSVAAAVWNQPIPVAVEGPQYSEHSYIHMNENRKIATKHSLKRNDKQSSTYTKRGVIFGRIGGVCATLVTEWTVVEVFEL